MLIRPCACNLPDCHYCAGGDHCRHCNPGNPATDEQMAAHLGITVDELKAQRTRMYNALQEISK